MSNFANPEKYVISWLSKRLREEYPKGFTTKQAEDLYVRERRRTRRFVHNPDSTDTYWVRMNCRNHLSCAVRVGQLTRVSRGNYKFSK